MRLSESDRAEIKGLLFHSAPEAECYLFGSRVDDSRRGGDIDLLLLSKEKFSLGFLRRLRRLILNRIGEQRLDIVNFPADSTHPFKTAVLQRAVRL
jgi:predicted nucleotidyltransferase